MLLLSVLLLILLPLSTICQSVNRVHVGFPDAWDGDRYHELYCPSKNIPQFLDGYFLCQLSAAYGNATAASGQKLTHMIDAIGAIGAFHISNGQVVFSAQYYPSRPFKIWEFYDRNMSKASVPWAGWSDYNLTAMARWEQVPTNPDSARFHPNLDFWRIGNKIVAGTEAPYWIGYEFDVRTLSKFKLFPFVEENEIFGQPRPSMIPISMAIHERNDADGTLWGSFSAMNFGEQRFFQGIFTISPSGVRKVVGLYDYGVWDANACGKDDEYIGDKTLLPGYIHSITSTEKYIILPITSLLINPCKFKEPPVSNPASSIQNGGLWGMDFYDMVPMRFLIFDKKTKEWKTEKPLEVFPSMFVSHQLNAFDSPDGTIIADMVVYDSHDPYVKYFYVDFLTSQLYPSTARVLRFVLDVKEHRVMYSYLIPQETIAADFPQFNHAYESKPYQWAYIVVYPFSEANHIMKVNVDDPSGSRNLNFKAAESSIVLHEPWFVARPDSRKEDDGVLLIRGLDVLENKGILIVVDAITMTELGRAYVPISIPFGFHNRFFSKQELGLPEGFYIPQFRPSFSTGGGKSSIPSTIPEWTRPTTAITPKYPVWWPKSKTNRSPPPPSSTNRGWRTTVDLNAAVVAAAALSTPSPYPITEPPIHPPYPTFPSILPHSVAKSIKDLYEETLQALCKWLPKVFRTISSELCIDRGTKAVSKLIATPWTTNMRLPNPFNPDIRRFADDQQRQPTKPRRRQGPFGV